MPSITPTPTEVPAQFVMTEDGVKMWNPNSGTWDRDVNVPESVANMHEGDQVYLNENGMPVFENTIYKTIFNGREWETKYF